MEDASLHGSARPFGAGQSFDQDVARLGPAPHVIPIRPRALGLAILGGWLLELERHGYRSLSTRSVDEGI